MDNVFGQDIALDTSSDMGMQARVAANGELILTDGADTGVQDIWLAISTYVGTLFYDTSYGSRIPDWFKEENTTANRLGFVAEVKRILRTDPRVEQGTETCTITAWDHTGITAEAAWQWIGDDHPYNIVFRAHDEDGTIKLKQVLADVRPNASTL